MIESIERGQALNTLYEPFSSMKEKKCKNCGKEITTKNNTFCSKYCKSYWRRGKTNDGIVYPDKTCIQCGKLMVKKSGEYSNVAFYAWKKKKFCSQSCQWIWVKGRHIHSHRKIILSKKNCKNCSFDMSKKYKYNDNRYRLAKFCSRQCCGEFKHKQDLLREKKRFCKNCGVIMKPFVHKVKRMSYGKIHSHTEYHKRNKFCDYDCYVKWRTGRSIEGRRKGHSIKRCLNCDKEIIRKLHKVNSTRRGKIISAHYLNEKFCCFDCHMKWKTAKTRDGKIYHDKKCRECGKKLKRINYPNVNYEIWKSRKYCSQECMFINFRKLEYHGLKKIKYCLSCGKKMLLDNFNQGREMWKNKRYCSMKCVGKLNKNPYHIRYFRKTPKEIQKIKDNISEKHRGSNSIHWRGGISFFPYDSNFNPWLKRIIKERDKVCQMCGKRIDSYGSCHHIHYDRTDSRIETLVLLHRECNFRANSNQDYWFAYFCHKLGQEPEAIL